MGIEPTSAGLESRGSAIELRPRKMVGRAGFEPAKAVPTDLQSVPFGHLGICPNLSSGASGGNRTHNLRFTKPLLYH